MENQDKIFEQFQKSAAKSEQKGFDAMEKVWNRVEEKLDKEDDKKAIPYWKIIGIAASLLLFFSLGYQFIQSDKLPQKPQNNVVVEESKDNMPGYLPEKVIVTTEQNPIIEKDAEKILQKQISAQSDVALNDTIGKKYINYETVGKSAAKSQKIDNKISDNVQSIVSEPAKIASKSITPQSAESVNVVTATEKNSITGESTITGVVTDSNKDPLPGANVAVRGKSTVTQTDIDGKFSIKADRNDILIFSYVGFNDAIVVVEKNKKMNIVLNENFSNLSEIVINSYSPKVQKNVSLAASTVISDRKQKTIANKYLKKAENVQYDMQSAPIAQNFTQSLNGKVAGIQFKSSPGATDQVVIRGYSSLQNGVEPLYVINGIVTTKNIINKIKPDQVKSIDVLKDAKATSLYGNRGKNGVIIINTNKLSAKENKALNEWIKADIANPQSDPKIIPSNPQTTEEDYDSFIENPFESPKAAPLSTFSIDVDNASYTNVRRFINNGQTVPKDAVRVEEMINFFKYDYPQPKDQNPFSINTEYSECPWNANHKLLKIGLQGKHLETDNLPASNLIFLIDVSGSMNDQNKLPLLKESMKILIAELRKKDKVAIVVYAGAAGVILPPTSGDEKQTIIDALEKLSAGGSTAGGAGIELAYKLAQENFIKGGNNRVILATDGDFNVGSSSNTDMQSLIEEKRKSGVFLTCLGYGMGNYKDSKMETLADKGNGNYAYIDNIQEANRFLGKEFKGSMFAIAKDVKIQIEFNPKHVQSYRLIGYENRKLRAEDFTNDAIDAGELGSGHTVTALYEIIPTGVKSNYFNETPQLKYTQTQPSAGNYNDELATVKFRYKKPDGDKSIEIVKTIEDKNVALQSASSDFKFSAAVAWFGLKLRDSKLVNDKSTEAIKKLAKQGVANDTEGYKAEFIRLVETAK